ncbi:MAG: HPr family phosphocarrier protein [candidate division WOR-3 bacterium]|nr:HPr family phosphocarrier protein [candidate division WOR-3 bacterium]MCX7837546.1 HPr family phosphocarrier protein [candidate division WOR-3 bacterium]MDW8113640.1 HPr family phosphocarrier protein [candidate division WOR-3 bacterium]
MVRENVKVEIEIGLHARPAAEFVKIAERFKSNIRVCKDGIWVNGKSILSLLTLAAEKGSELILEADGIDEKEAIAALKKFLSAK